MQVELTPHEISIIRDLLNQEITFQQQEPEHEEEIKAQIKPFQKLLNKLEVI